MTKKLNEPTDDRKTYKPIPLTEWQQLLLEANKLPGLTVFGKPTTTTLNGAVETA